MYVDDTAAYGQLSVPKSQEVPFAMQARSENGSASRSRERDLSWREILTTFFRRWYFSS